jgi:hypothetical protein
LPKHPFYVFSEQNNRIKILLSKSGLCNWFFHQLHSPIAFW